MRILKIREAKSKVPSLSWWLFWIFFGPPLYELAWKFWHGG